MGLIASSSRRENTSAKISTKSASCLCVVGTESLRPRLEGSSTQVMSIPIWGIDCVCAEEDDGCEKMAVAVDNDEDDGMIHPASATSDA